MVPAAIYTIPASSPLHYVTYVHIYEATPTVVYVGYTPGYMGVGNQKYADVNGNVYHNDGSGWQQHSSSGWGAASGDTSWADRESQARSTGDSHFGGFGSYGGGDRFGGDGFGGGDRFGGSGGFVGRFGGGFRR